MTFSRFRPRLLSTLRLLAQPASVQLSYLSRFGPDGCADELRLQYEAVMSEAEPFVGRELSAAQVRMLLALASHLGTMSAGDRAHLWKEQSLRRSAEWAQVRELAAQALLGLDAWPRSWGKGRLRSIRASAEAARRLA